MLHVRCPFCSTVLQAPEALAGTTAACATCGKAIEVPGPAGLVATAPRPAPAPAERARPRRRFEDDDERAALPALPPAGSRRPPSGGLRFISPSFLVLALLTLPFPWLEVRCNSSNVQPRTHYSQTGLQLLVGRSTVLTPPPAPAA